MPLKSCCFWGLDSFLGESLGGLNRACLYGEWVGVPDGDGGSDPMGPTLLVVGLGTSETLGDLIISMLFLVAFNGFEESVLSPLICLTDLLTA